jgi:hypothetical protein
MNVIDPFMACSVAGERGILLAFTNDVPLNMKPFSIYVIVDARPICENA